MLYDTPFKSRLHVESFSDIDSLERNERYSQSVLKIIFTSHFDQSPLILINSISNVANYQTFNCYVVFNLYFYSINNYLKMICTV